MDTDDLRESLVDYFGAATPIFPVAWADVSRVESASRDELIGIARENGVSTGGMLTVDEMRDVLAELVDDVEGLYYLDDDEIIELYEATY